ncbi:class I SAM-dependent methyltransferase [Methylocystis sp. WRRC1]|uniref:class I SAM-dependent methyltransferase n=1 Tax=Methylocystis sp. WRRC1 TaxID=1732014 RepID=UPI001D13C334|nr:class I SAM-dependent methyltransferase [Methylocystis sp. WRRC1]MCC3243788.1 class I SAM-dependent methyltransferase [Methylocystis sp. WRRC1]
MKKTISGLSLALMLGGGAALAQAPAEAPSEKKMDHGGMNHGGMDHGAMGDQKMGDHKAMGDGGYHHRFEDAEKWAKQFDKPDRDAWQKPDQVLDALKLAPNASVADIGAGTGYFSVRIAKRVPQGKVFSADIEKDMVRYLGERAKKEGLANIVPVQASPESANLSEPVDVILLVDAYHHIGNRVDYFKKLQSSLKPGGKLVIIDFRMENTDGPPKEHRVSIEKATEELKSAGYSLIETQDFLPRQYLAVFKKSGA